MKPQLMPGKKTGDLEAAGEANEETFPRGVLLESSLLQEMTMDLSKSKEASLDQLDPQQDLKKQLKIPFLEESC